MPTYLLTWNPKKSPLDVDALHQGSKTLAKGKKFVGSWSAGNTKGIKRGDRVFLLRQGSYRPGMIGSGIVATSAELRSNWDPKQRRAGKKALFVDVKWQDLLPNHELGRASLLKGILPPTLLKVAASGAQIPPELCAQLEARWAAHVASGHQPSSAPVPTDIYSDPTPIATTAQFKQALLKLRAREDITPKHLAMLRAHYEATAHTITTQQLAEAAGYGTHSPANSQYGDLAHRIATALNYRAGEFPDGKPHWWRTLAYGNADATYNPEGRYEWIMRPELVAALQELNWVSTPRAARPLQISPLTFNRQFARFAAQVRHSSDGQPFTSFHAGLPAEWEDYKEDVRNEALRLLNIRSWKRSDVGTGRILTHVIQAIEIHDSSRKIRNNLVAWQNRFGHQKRAHRALLDARKSAPARRELEQWCLDFFQNRLEDEEAFERLRRLVGSRYDLVAYLFFLKDWLRFMPIAPTTFDKAFKLLGVDLVTSLHCSWENYSHYNAVFTEVKTLLRDIAEVAEARLIDAHSFCWMLVRLDLPTAAKATTIPLPRTIGSILPITRPSAPASAQSGEFDVVTDEDHSEREERRRRLGNLAQDIALQSERRRLHELGLVKQDESVRPVWNEPARGYDILSIEPDGSPRHIEVKSTRRSGGKLSFYLSDYEWKISRTKPNYWFYLVLETESTRPDVIIVPAADISSACLAPVTYLASFTVGEQ